MLLKNGRLIVIKYDIKVKEKSVVGIWRYLFVILN